MKRLACLCVSYVLMSFGGRGALCQPTQERSQNGHQVERDPFPGESRLSRDALVRAVLERNPTIEVARSEADAARYDYQAVRLQLAAMASLLFDDYYFAERALEINGEHTRLLEEFQRIATVRYVSGLAAQQDPIQAEVELAHALHRDVVLRTGRETTVA